MNAECISIAGLPGTTALFRDYAEVAANAAVAERLRRWYPTDPFSMEWAERSPVLDEAHRGKLADALKAEAVGCGASEAAFANIEKLRAGAAAVVTGQQVGLFGGPLLTLLKAATAIRKAQEATRVSGREHVPVFWLATEDHDLAEVDQLALLKKAEVETLRLGLREDKPLPVGALALDGGTAEGRATLEAQLERASELLAWAPAAEWLREAYAPGQTMGGGFGRLLAKVFAEYGLVVIDAASRAFHALGARALRAGIEQADALEAALLERTAELEGAGYHAQVLIAAGHSLVFLIDAETGARLPLRRVTEAGASLWKAGTRTYETAELLAILESEPERLSPNALLRPVFQDCVLPTAAYVGGPAEVAYFAQSAVVYQAVLGRVTPVLPRLSATLIEPAIAQVMATHEVSLEQLFEEKTVDALALRLGARALPIEAKRKLAAVGNAMEKELTALGEYMSAMSDDLGKNAEVSASKMRYQMDRLRRMAAQFEVQKETSLKKHATAIMLNLFPAGGLQERLIGGVWFLARYGETLPALLVEHAAQECPGHRVIKL
ncbi:MAG: bacillithiol biosynthesis cysteine-adding enzyme BshC [Acidobacteriota bacterium]